MAHQADGHIPPPFQCYAAYNDPLSHLTWQQCFDFDRDHIRNHFVLPLQNAPDVRYQHTWSIKVRADLLQYMLGRPQGDPASIVVLKETEVALQTAQLALPQAHRRRIAEVTELSPSEEGVGFVEWSPIYNERRKLHCHTIFDLLAGAMSEAATTQNGVAPSQGFLENLLSLFAVWCTRIASATRVPTLVAIVEARGTMLLGATIPDVPGLHSAKDQIRIARAYRLAGQYLKEDAGRHDNLVCREAKSMAGGQKYGNCAETTFFSLLCMMNKDDRVCARGLAIMTLEKSQKRMCDNCHRMAKLCIEDDAGRNGRSVAGRRDTAWWYCTPASS